MNAPAKIHHNLPTKPADILAAYEAKWSADMQAFVETHEDVPFAELIHKGCIKFRLIRIINGDEAEGEGSTMQAAYEAAERNHRRSNAALRSLIGGLA